MLKSDQQFSEYVKAKVVKWGKVVRETGARKASEERMPLKKDFGRILRVVLRNAVALARAETELRELERNVFPHGAVALALVFLHIGVGIVVFVAT